MTDALLAAAASFGARVTSLLLTFERRREHMVSSSGCARRCFRGRWQPPAACTKHAASLDHAGRTSGLLRSKRKLSPVVPLSDQKRLAP